MDFLPNYVPTNICQTFASNDIWTNVDRDVIGKTIYNGKRKKVHMAPI